jgi:predicted PurR-regulated permease PerM
METTSFVLGMLSIIAVAFMAVIVWGIVKINKLTSEVTSTHKWIDNTVQDRDYQFQQIYKKFDQVERTHNDDFERSYNHISSNFDHLDRKINEQERAMSLEFERAYNQIAECRSYTDSRFDKLASNTKQLIKG